ncbi:ornithine cyclodeaminase family protein [Amycolatopsis nigrescens]|uniref:ornithine cyclodeaminase family protein n=1 Tax=Amycolatopsis nigrescens TaxID=381445 RepID=UPI000364CE9C|nr:ornithine cyclodeaminase family protein [Amycolatopsis nigrescens]
MIRSYDAAEIAAALDVPAAIESQWRAFTALATGVARMPEKIMVPGPGDGSVALAYAARVSPETGPVCKFVSFNPGNDALGLPSINGMIVALHQETGVPVALLDGAAITTARTSAASAVAVDALAVPEAGELAVIGCGAQGRAHVRAIAAVRAPRRVRMFSPTAERRREAVAALAREFPVEESMSVAEAVDGADMVVLCTVSEEPVLSASQVSPGALVLAVGSFEPHRREVGRDLLAMAAAVVVDHAGTAAAHAGPVLDALAAGVITEPLELGDVLLGRSTARRSPEDVIFYNSTGIAVQDAAAVWAVLTAAG